MGLTAAQFLCGAILLIPYLFSSGDVGASDWGSRRAVVVDRVHRDRRAGGRLPDVLHRPHALAELARLPVDVPLARGRDPDRGDPRQPPGRPCPPSAWRSSWPGLVVVNLPAAEAPALPAVAPSRLDRDVAEDARRGEPIDLRIRVAALRHQHLARVLAAPGCRRAARSGARRRAAASGSAARCRARDARSPRSGRARASADRRRRRPCR